MSSASTAPLHRPSSPRPNCRWQPGPRRAQTARHDRISEQAHHRRGRLLARCGVRNGPPGRVRLPGRRKEIGHLHGDRPAHFGFPKGVWQELFDQGRIGYHPAFPGRPGFGARGMATDEDVDEVIALMRLNYDRVTAA